MAVQDSFAFRRKKWYYLILDEAQNIKNFQSQRWQTLVNFHSQRRLLLTGTPLQNNLMELWSLLHFLMPHVFRSRKEFSYWFSNPMNNIVEGQTRRNEDLIRRLHGIIRPFVLRRLKKDVEKQMPDKFEHVVKCQLSRRQMFLYEEFMNRSATRKSMTKGGNFLGMMNVLMQLRKVCNHPDLFEPRAIVTPFTFSPIVYVTPSLIANVLTDTRALQKQVSSCLTTNIFYANRILDKTALEAIKCLKTPASIIEEVDLNSVEKPKMLFRWQKDSLKEQFDESFLRRKKAQVSALFHIVCLGLGCTSVPADPIVTIPQLTKPCSQKLLNFASLVV